LGKEMEVDVERNVSTIQDRPMLGFREQIKESTADGSELVEVVLGVLRDQNASNRERIEAATWLADRGFAKPAAVRDDDVPGIGDFTIVLNLSRARTSPVTTTTTQSASVKWALNGVFCVLCGVNRTRASDLVVMSVWKRGYASGSGGLRVLGLP
jgi:hypothetical protein